MAMRALEFENDFSGLNGFKANAPHFGIANRTVHAKNRETN
jgi:hypothetical protein